MKTMQVSDMVSVMTILVSLILGIFQFAGIIHLRVDEMLCLIIALLIIISGSLFGERLGTLRKIQEKLEQMEKLIKQKNK
jgi:divalent metal cation (Fe/Co/Zn/Cd) transporter